MKTSNLATVDTVTGEILEDIAPPQNGGFKKCKTHTAAGREVAMFTCVVTTIEQGKLKKVWYRSDTEGKKIRASGKQMKDWEAILLRFEEFAWSAVEIVVYDNRPEMENNNVVVKVTQGTIVKSKYEKYKVGNEMLQYNFQKYTA